MVSTDDGVDGVDGVGRGWSGDEQPLLSAVVDEATECGNALTVSNQKVRPEEMAGG